MLDLEKQKCYNRRNIGRPSQTVYLQKLIFKFNLSRRLVPVVGGFLLLFRLSSSTCQINFQHSNTKVRPLIAITNLYISHPLLVKTREGAFICTSPVNYVDSYEEINRLPLFTAPYAI